MMLYETFNRSTFSHFLNSSRGRVFRLAAGSAFFVAGCIFRDQPLGVLSLVWSIFPLSAGAFDLCYISAALGGPLSGKVIRESYI
jgi:hypothetical protein